ncbi:LPXTG cell wall anchor domain-containing protein [Streptomyces tateyamensis]|uniref:LPXTG cell wall anchor domain-containing protein n=1 Tax=Streptomyces tateyamensis TaxID=565073 RepID=UPI0015E88E59|nr:LPXTG cell wall anchor domain-containing protein [Streptomyces tateyamensis]
MRRPLALLAATALVSGAALAGAQSALAVVASPSPTATASTGSAGAAAGQNVPANAEPKLEVEGLRHEVDAGGQTEFTVEFTNRTGADLVFIPFIRVQTKAGDLANDSFQLDYRRGKADWQHSTIPAYFEDVRVFGPEDDQGVPQVPASLVPVKAGKSVSIKVRLGLPDDAPTGPAYVQYFGLWLPAAEAGQSSEALEQIAVSEPAFFCIGGGGDNDHSHKPSPSPSPSHTHKPSPTPSSSATTGKPTPSSSATTGSPTPSSSPTTSSPTPSSSATTASPTPSSTSSSPVATPSAPDTAPPVTPFPVTPPKPVTVPIPTAAVQQAQAAEDKDLAYTGGGSDATPLAIAGATVLAAGIGTLVVLRRRKQAGRHA